MSGAVTSRVQLLLFLFPSVLILRWHLHMTFYFELSVSEFSVLIIAPEYWVCGGVIGENTTPGRAVWWNNVELLYMIGTYHRIVIWHDERPQTQLGSVRI